MKKIIVLLCLSISLMTCKNESHKDAVVDKESLEMKAKDQPIASITGKKQLKGEFIYFGDAAVLQTPSEVYGVVIDSMMHALNDKVKRYKKEDTDMVPVAIMGDVTQKNENEEGWPYRVKVLQILKVYKPQANSNNVIKLEKQEIK